MNTLTLQILFAQPDNAGVWWHLKIRGPEDVRFFRAATDGSPFDEGGQVFFHEYARLVPKEARCTLGITNLLAHERTGRIFALHHGRFTFAVRTDFSPTAETQRRLLRGGTLDGSVDLIGLGPGWQLLRAEEEEGAEVFRAAYDLAET